MIALLTALVLATPLAPVETIDWPTLVTRIQATNPLMREARAGLERFEAALKGTQWRYFPVFELKAHVGIGPEGGALEADAPAEVQRWGDTYRVGVVVEQPLYTFGKIEGLKAAARHGVEIGEAVVQAARWELIARAARAYQGALMAREVEATLREGRRWVDKVNQRLEALRRSDAADYDPLVHLRLKSRVGDLAQMESDNAALLSESHDALRMLLSRPVDQPVRPHEDQVEVSAFALKPLAYYLEVAQKSRPEVTIAEAKVQAQGALMKQARAEMLPELLLLGEFHALGSETLERPLALPNQGSVGMSAGVLFAMRWRFDAGSSLHRSAELDARARQLRAAADKAQQATEAEVRRLYGRLSRQRDLIAAKRESRAAAKSWLINAWELYDTGFGKLPEVMDALERVWLTRLGHLHAIVTHNVMVIELSGTVGLDLLTAQGEAP